MRECRLFLAVLATAITVMMSGCNATAPTHLDGKTMGTTYQVTIMGLDPSVNVQELGLGIQQRLDEINSLMSTYDPESELSRFNQVRHVEWVPVSSELATVVHYALEVSRKTDGAFDITVGPLVNLWNFGPAQHEHALPQAADIATAMGTIGYQHLSARTAPPALRKNMPGLEIDLSALAKGYAVDEICQLLEAFTTTGYLVEIGGDTRAAGHSLHQQPWRIGIEKPIDDQRQVGAIVELHNAALASSGDYRNFFIHEGQRYSHTIDPRTGAPVTHHTAAASVMAPSCMEADAWATAMMVLEDQVAYDIAKQNQLAILLTLRTEEGFHQTRNQAFTRVESTSTFPVESR